jgi:hypothetical protein
VVTSRTALDDLKREVESRKAAVAEREADLEKARVEAEEYVARKIARAEQALAKARAELSGYVGDLARALGLPDLAAARGAKTRRRRVGDLARAGRTAAEIAAELVVPLDVVEDDLAKIRSKAARSTVSPVSPPEDVEVGKKGWKSAMVLRLTLAGKSVDEVAESMSTSKQNVLTALWYLRRQGHLPPRESKLSAPAPSAPAPPAPAPVRAEPAPEETDGEEDDDPDDPAGSSTQALREEVARQQGGDRSVWARVPTTDQRGHRHLAEVDRMGDGATLPDDGTGHRHSVVKFLVSRADDHVHELLARKG